MKHKDKNTESSESQLLLAPFAVAAWPTMLGSYQLQAQSRRGMWMAGGEHENKKTDFKDMKK